jgi:RNA polymerase sigma-70 factor, ECF subfamily
MRSSSFASISPERLTSSLSVNSTPDAELIEQILSGRRELYAELVGRYQEMLYRFALGMVRDPDQAADLVQDTFVKAFASLHSCRDRENFRAWIFRILRNRCTDHLRTPARRSVSLEAHEKSLFARDEADAFLEQREVRAAVDRALLTLPETQREAFLLKHVENLSYEEMAEVLETGVSSLKMRVMRAREALREALRQAGISDFREM